ncbi:MAG: SUMF1/EgtB/PvdO family nonheme iron enzyme [Magnetococcales bacterium]|nr:SUMF1/EgtB/PvdO family nonheme iron enzyme [Magnetococcales bacterium]
MNDRKVVRIFISSPGDVNPEREVARQVIARLDREFSCHFRLEAVWWEREPLLATESPQDGITPPSSTDIVLVILWSRLGSFLSPEKYQGKVTGKTPVTGTEWEFEDAVKSHRERNKPDVLLYRKQAEITASLSDDDVFEQKRLQKKMVEDFLKTWLVEESTGILKGMPHPFTDAGQLEEMLETHLRTLLRRRLELPEGEAVQGGIIRWHDGSPFRGLASFELKHAPILFGRTKERQELRDALASQAARGCAFLLVFGASGSGKSSLVKAGLLSDLKIPGMMEKVGLVRHAIVRPTDDEDLYAVLARGFLSEDALPKELARLQYDQTTLAGLMKDSPRQAVLPIRQGLAKAGEEGKLINDAQARLLLIVDQLEELFTQPKVGQTEREGFVLALKALAESGLVWVIATMRSDFFDRLVTLPELVRLSKESGRYLLEPPTLGAIGRIIRQPAWEAGLRFEKGSKSGIGLDELLHEAASKNGALLPLLSFALEELWDRRTEQGVLTHAAYEAMGKLDGSLGRKAEEVFGRLNKEEQAALAGMIRQLVTVGIGDGGKATTRTVSLSRFGEGTPARRLVDLFLSPTARLLVADGDGAGAQVRVVHESLLGHWPRAAQQIERDRQDLQLRGRLEQEAAWWRIAEEENREEFLLPYGFRLRESQNLLKRWTGEGLEPGVVEYIEASVSRIQKQFNRQQLTPLLVLLVVSLLFGGYRGVMWGVKMYRGVQAVEEAMEFVSIPKGCFQMGSPETEMDRNEDEKQHEVCVEGFDLGKFEVTQWEWEQVMHSNLSPHKKDKNPAEIVSWFEVMEFAKYMNWFGKYRYRLPTEAEWEYAARGGTKSSRYWGEDEKKACQYANVPDIDLKSLMGKAVGAWFGCSDGYAFGVAPAGSFKANAFGLHDMLGNVWEWTCSAYVSGYDRLEKNCAKTEDAGSRRVIRGGGWFNHPANVRSAYRRYNVPDIRFDSVGFRLARTYP